MIWRCLSRCRQYFCCFPISVINSLQSPYLTMIKQQFYITSSPSQIYKLDSNDGSKTLQTPGQELLSILDTGQEEKTKIIKELLWAEKDKARKSQEIQTFLKHIDQNETSNKPEIKQRCHELLENFNEFITMHKKDTIKYKNLHLQTLFALMEAYYQNGVKHESESDKELMERMNSVFECFPNLGPLKRHCLIGAVFLADNHSLKFYDYLKIHGITIDHNLVNLLCRIAHAAKNAAILEPIIEMPIFIKSLRELAKLYEQTALIYGQKRQLDKLDWLWRHLLKMKEIRKNDRIIFKPALYRVAHFYRMANIRLPEELAKELRRMDDHLISFYPSKKDTNYQK